MTEVLTQDEIDKLLTAISAGDVETKNDKPASGTRRIKIYDFKRPDALTITQIRTLSLVHEDFARRLAPLLGSYFNTDVSVHVTSVDLLTYEQFIRSIPNPGGIALITMHPLDSMVFEIDPGVSSIILNKLFGGEQTKCKPTTDLSGLEKVSLGWIIGKIMLPLKEAWKDIADVNPELNLLDTNPQIFQKIPPGEMALLATFEVRICGEEGMINLCLPVSTLEPVLDKITAYFSPGIKSAGRPLNPAVCGKIVMDVQAVLFRKEIPYREILAWKKGAMLYPSVAHNSRRCTLYSGGMELFSASLIEEQPFFNKRITLTRIGNFKEDTMHNKDLKFQKDATTMQEALNRMSINCTAELGRLKAAQEEMLSWQEGTIITLDKLAGEPIDIYANNVLVAKGEVVVIGENFGVRIIDLPIKEDEAK
jgi:flagellar motor switch protein FliM